MPDVDKKTVPIDTSGPDKEIELPEEKQETAPIETEAPKEEVKAPEEKVVVEEKKEEPAVETKEEVEKPQEEKKDQELSDYSEGVQKRISKLTKKWREAERQKDAAVKYAEGVIVDQRQMKSRLSKLEPGFLHATEESIKTGLDAAKAKLAAAREANDLGAETEAMASISELGYKKAKYLEAKEAQDRVAKRKSQPMPSLQDAMKSPQLPADPKAEGWAEKNSWFGTDSAMTYTAFDIHKRLTEDQGFDTSSDEYYAEIDKQMKLAFPQKFGTTDTKESTKPVQQVASAKRSTNTGRRKVRLTSSELAIAKKLGVPPEEYAKQKLNITKEV
jgi:hypothetical protein|tara:strand:+ start:1007 stop:1999 length:993 start_codon:yes stop_codon:yes gene_type:complete